MKTLLIMRHAKSVHPDGMADHDRPLNDRGLRDAPRMGLLLKEQGLLPDIIVSSTAVRALSTAQLASEACGFEGRIATDRTLYLPEPADMLRVLREQPDSAACVMLVSHNPGSEAIVHALTGSYEAMPTAAVARIEIDTEAWSTWQPERGATLKNLWRPRDLDA
jgi:phosphohistidine phosphatase